MLGTIKASILNLGILGTIVGLTGCNLTNAVASTEEKPLVIASHSIICDLVTTLAEDTIELNCLIDPTQDPHTYRPSPSQRQAMEEAQFIFYGGYELEPKISQLLETSSETEAKTATPKIALYEEAIAEPIQSAPEHKGEEELVEYSQGETQPEAQLKPDPHIWHNVENVVAMVETVQPILMKLNPLEAELYLKNSSALTEELWQLDNWIDEQVATIPPGQKILITPHNSLNYYVTAYGFDDYKTLQGISSASSPTASGLRNLATEIRQTGVPTIFAESTASDRVIKNVARAAKVKLAEQKLYVDGLGETDSYMQMMVSNTCAIVDGLGGKCQAFE